MLIDIFIVIFAQQFFHIRVILGNPLELLAKAFPTQRMKPSPALLPAVLGDEYKGDSGMGFRAWW